jgi:integrase
VRDTELKGLCARRQRGTAVSYLLKTRLNGRIRSFTIGRHGQPWTPDTARKHARDILSNPSIADKPSDDITQPFTQAAERFLDNHGPKLKPSTLADYRRLVHSHLVPVFGKMRLDAITRADVSNAHAKWKDNPRTAKYVLAIMSKLMTWAEDQGHRADDTNPCRRVQRYKENKREYFMQPDELARLGQALDTASTESLISPFAHAAILLLILTGARLNEILTLQWAHVDLGRRMLFLPDSKTGQKPITLNDAAIAILNALPRFAHNPYVIVGRHGAHLANLTKPWHLVRKLAGLDNVRIHDLRHTSPASRSVPAVRFRSSAVSLATASPKPLSAMLISATIRCASSPTTPDSSSQTPSGANRASRRSASCAGGCRSL